MKIKIYEVEFIYGFINPSIRKEKIETVIYPNEVFIREELEKINNKYKNQIINILSVLLIDEKEISKTIDKTDNNNNNQAFNW